MRDRKRVVENDRTKGCKLGDEEISGPVGCIFGKDIGGSMLVKKHPMIHLPILAAQIIRLPSKLGLNIPLKDNTFLPEFTAFNMRQNT